MESIKLSQGQPRWAHLPEHSPDLFKFNVRVAQMKTSEADPAREPKLRMESDHWICGTHLSKAHVADAHIPKIKDDPDPSSSDDEDDQPNMSHLHDPEEEVIIFKPRSGVLFDDGRKKYVKKSIRSQICCCCSWCSCCSCCSCCSKSNTSGTLKKNHKRAPAHTKDKHRNGNHHHHSHHKHRTPQSQNPNGTRTRTDIQSCYSSCCPCCWVFKCDTLVLKCLEKITTTRYCELKFWCFPACMLYSNF